MNKTLALALLAAAPVSAQSVSSGDRPEFTFRDALVNGRGARSLADLRGRPLLIDFWGTR